MRFRLAVTLNLPDDPPDRLVAEARLEPGALLLLVVVATLAVEAVAVVTKNR